MAHFKVRKNGNDLKNLKQYNNADWSKELNDYTNNSFFPEFAPKSVGGTMSGVSFKDSKGNCTWYAFGRYLEVFGVRPKKPLMRPDAKYWGTNGEKLSNSPQVGGIVVFGDSGYGHVAFIEKIVGKDVILSESSYSTRGNDFLFKYGRTIEQVKREWGMTVLRYIAPFESSTSFEDDDLIAEDGYLIITEDVVNLRAAASTKSKDLGNLYKDERFDYSHKIAADGHMWVTNGEVFVAHRELDGEKFSTAHFKKESVPKPKPDPETIIGKFANLGGNMWLFEVANTDRTYHPSGMGYNQLQSIRNRSAKILADENGRVKISVPSFRPNVVWVAKSQISITNQALHAVN